MCRLYELEENEIEKALSFRNSIFSPVNEEQWRAMNCTAAMARHGEELVGCIPLQFRRQILRPGVHIPVVYENAVGVSEKCRSQGVGTKMLDSAAGFIADRADALMVLRGGERDIGYRFYRKTGHSDLLHSVEYNLPAEENIKPSYSVESVDRAEWLRLEPELLSLFERECGNYGREQTPGERILEDGSRFPCLQKLRLGVLYCPEGGTDRRLSPRGFRYPLQQGKFFSFRSFG